MSRNAASAMPKRRSVKSRPGRNFARRKRKRKGPMPHRSVRPVGITSTLDEVDDSDWRSAVATDVVDIFSELIKSCEMFCSFSGQLYYHLYLPSSPRYLDHLSRNDSGQLQRTSHLYNQ